MKLVNATVTYYRSVENSEQFTVEPDVTCLVGKNESGKTTVLQALYRLKPVEKVGLDEVEDFPAKLTRRRKDWGATQKIPVVVATFRYDEHEIERIEDDLGSGALDSPEFTVSLGYRDKSHTYAHRYNETAIVKHLQAGLDLPSAAAAAVNATSTIAELLAALSKLDEPPTAATALADRIRSWRNQSLGLYLIDEYASPLMPKFVYFGDYDVMPGKVSIPDLIRRRTAHELKRGEVALLSLLDMANVKLEDFKRTDRHERHRRVQTLCPHDQAECRKGRRRRAGSAVDQLSDMAGREGRAGAVRPRRGPDHRHREGRRHDQAARQLQA